MKKIAILLIAIMIIGVSFLSGCDENKSKGTQEFVKDLQLTEDFVSVLLNNFYVYQTDFDTQFKWVTLMNQVIMKSTIENMENIRSSIINDMGGMDSAEKVHYESKLNASMGELTSQEKDQIDKIEEMINYYNFQENNLLDYVDNLELYTDFMNYTRIKIILLEDIQNVFILMNDYVENEDYDKAVEKGLELLQIYYDLKDNEFARADLNILDYSEKILSVWDLYIEGMHYYIEHLNLTIDGKYSQAEAQYNLYEDKYNQAIEIEGSENLTETNEKIDTWYTDNIGDYKDIFIDYYQYS